LFEETAVRTYVLVMMPFVSLALAGCGGETYPSTVPVTGVVNYQGKPVDGATVTLVPTDAKGRSASGITAADGKFSVKTFYGADHNPEGALPGDYLISVTKTAAAATPPAGMTQWEEQSWYSKQGAPKPLLPKQYMSPERSGLKVTVGKSSPDPLTLDLKD
jgi:hypothetical protein